MRQILFVSYGSPLTQYSGYSYRALGILQWLVERYTVGLIFQGQCSDLAKSFVPLHKLSATTVVPMASGFSKRLSACIALLPFHHALACDRAMTLALQKYLREQAYDLIWLNKSLHVPILEKLQNQIPVVIDQHAAERCVWDNLIENDPRWHIRVFSRWNKRRVLRLERRVYKKLAGVVCISQPDERLTNLDHPGTKTLCVPQGFDPHYYKPAATASPDFDTLLFSGTDAIRNLEAGRMFIERIMPLIHQRESKMRLLWIGHVENTKYKFLGVPWVETTGFVEHAPPHFDRGMIYVAPFEMGEGMKTKIIEAMAMGKVIVATPVAVQGIEVHGLPFVKVCQSPTEFARAVLELRNTKELRRLGEYARTHALAHFTWDHVLGPLEVFLEQCCNLPVQNP